MTVFKVDVDMAFNHDRGVNDGTDGINIRQNGSDNTEHHAPEIRNNAPGYKINPASGNPEPESWSSPNGFTDGQTVLYLKDKAVTSYNRFVMTPHIPGLTLSLEATVAGLAIGGWKEEDVTFTQGLTAPNPQKTVSTGTKAIAGVAGFVEFEAKSNTSAAVNKETGAFTWNVNKIKYGGKEKSNGGGTMATTAPVTIYTVLDVPKDPWNPSDTISLLGYPYPAEDNKMQPWVTVLETLTNAAWCGGNTTVEQVAAAVTTNLYEGGKFRYEAQGSRNFQVFVPSLSYFSLTLFHNRPSLTDFRTVKSHQL
jgi:hypothetical protein